VRLGCFEVEKSILGPKSRDSTLVDHVSSPIFKNIHDNASSSRFKSEKHVAKQAHAFGLLFNGSFRPKCMVSFIFKLDYSFFLIVEAFSFELAFVMVFSLNFIWVVAIHVYFYYCINK
jgi:hypothetical protein